MRGEVAPESKSSPSQPKNWGLHWNSNTLRNFYDAAWDPNGHWNDGLFPPLSRQEGFPY